ncbi:putative disease resistance RPP13-like protein 1 [Abeliophyllum distichum]|uniref:Disease resistance RPP13-like protein 1 n=1 Tax=Abeliophyllum distichum TaxID=126358 RepID=A0ABD1TX44_9LAMI
MIQQLLDDAERKGVTDPQVKAWLRVIEDAVYELYDALDVWEMKIHELEMEGSEDVSDCWEKTSPNLTEFQALLQCIETTVSGKRFLLVLDDVWKHDHKKWEPLKICLSKGAPGSKILVTTRNESVAKMMGSVDTHLLRPLSDSECFALLSQIAFEKQKEYHNILEAIGRENSQKCSGLPLAAKTLGSLLRFKDTVQEWNNVLSSEIWQMEIAEFEIFPHLYLSYNELRPAVKRCFLYCAIFSIDSEINVNTLIRMWMAQGFLLVNLQRRWN